MSRTLRLLDKNGDVVISWTAEHDEEIEKIIEKKMAEGMTFFVLEVQAGGLLPPIKHKLESAGDARKYRAITIDDPDFSAFVESGKGTVVSAPTGKPMKTTRRAKSAKEVTENTTVGLKPKRGG